MPPVDGYDEQKEGQQLKVVHSLSEASDNDCTGPYWFHPERKTAADVLELTVVTGWKTGRNWLAACYCGV